jgi:hypothetical protein
MADPSMACLLLAHASRVSLTRIVRVRTPMAGEL